MESLAEIALRHTAEGADPGHGDKLSVHSYIPEYERLLAPYRTYCRFMEIGLASGLSMKMWGDYFGDEVGLFGVDIHIAFDTKGFDPRFTFVEGDATKPEILT